MRSRGQTLSEYAVILGLVGLVAIASITIFGDSISKVFAHPAVASTKAKFNPQQYNANLAQPPEIPNSSLPHMQSVIDSTDIIAGKQVNYHTDGSVSFELNGRSYLIPKNIIDYQTNVSQAGARESIEDLISTITEMNSKYNPDGDLPVEINFGIGTRMTSTDVSFEREGNNPANATSVKIGNHIGILYKDQSKYCTDVAEDCDFYSPQKFMVDLTIDKKTNKVSGSSIKIKDNSNGKYKHFGKLASNETIISKNGSGYEIAGMYSSEPDSETVVTSQNWDINFGDPNKSIILK